MVRRPGKDKAHYFGPYASSQAVKETLRTLYRAFPFAPVPTRCSIAAPSPCLYYEIHTVRPLCAGVYHASSVSRTGTTGGFAFTWPQ